MTSHELPVSSAQVTPLLILSELPKFGRNLTGALIKRQNNMDSYDVIANQPVVIDNVRNLLISDLHSPSGQVLATSS